MTLAEHSYHGNMMVQNSQFPFFHIHFQKHKENGVPQNRNLWSLLCNHQMELISPRSIPMDYWRVQQVFREYGQRTQHFNH